jgi:hypothetical protein
MLFSQYLPQSMTDNILDDHVNEWINKEKTILSFSMDQGIN